MISFFSTPSGVTSCQYYLQKRGRQVSDCLIPTTYEDLLDLNRVPAGASIFAAIDQLSPMEREAFAGVWEQLFQAGQNLLNHPTRSLDRYRLLRGLYGMGRNQFQVYRASDSSQVERFPVFVREELKHDGNLTPLLFNQEELEYALKGLIARGHRDEHLLIVEYCDASDASGTFRKYSAFKIGGVILAKHLMFSNHWMVKQEVTLTDDQVNEELVHEAQTYIRTNPHEAWIREIFEFAEIQYGRIDYGYCNGRPQVWEINTDPTIGYPPMPRKPGRDKYRAVRRQGQDFFHEKFRVAWRDIDRGPAGVQCIQIHLDERLRVRLKDQRRRDMLRHVIQRQVEKFVDTPLVQGMKPLLNRVARIAPRFFQAIRLRPK